MEQMQGIMIVEALGLIRACLSAMLADLEGVSVLATIDDYYHAMVAIGSLKPRLLLVGVSSPAPRIVEFIRSVKRLHPDVRLIALTFTQRQECIDACIHAGADGYVLREANRGELAAAIRSAVDGKCYSSANKTADIFSKESRDRHIAGSAGASDKLTQREREVMRLVAMAYTNKAISRHIGVSISTVEKHRANMLKKLNLHNVAEVTAYAIERGWVTADDLH